MVDEYCRAESVGEARGVRVESLNDLVRLASTLAGRMVVMPVYRLRSERGSLYFLQMMYKDFYRCYGLPVIYYFFAEGDVRDASEARYILVRGDETGERVEVSDRTRTGWVIVPVINLAEPPEYLPEEAIRLLGLAPRRPGGGHPSSI